MLAVLLFTALSAEPDLELGRSIYAAKCTACHGVMGKGDGAVSLALPQPPADFSAAAYWKRADDKLLRAVITSGKPGTVMRGFPMKPAHLDSLVAYLRTLAPKPE